MPREAKDQGSGQASSALPLGSGAQLLVRIDGDRCVGHGRCYSLAPVLFESDEVGKGVLKGQPANRQEEEAAVEAARNCPEGAISLAESYPG